MYNQLDINTYFNNQFSNIFIAKISEGGNLKWHKEIGQDLGSASNASNRSYDICYDDSLGLIITGDISGYVTFGDTAFNSYADLNYLAQYDTAGNYIKIRTFNSGNINLSQNKLTIDKNNSIYLSGAYYSSVTGTHSFNLDGNNISSTNSDPMTYFDLFIFKFNCNMQNASVLTLKNDTSIKYFCGKTITYDNKFVIVGQFENSIFFNDGYVMNNNGYTDVFVLSIKDTLNNNIENHLLNHQNCNIYPNPTSGKITITADEIENIVIMNIEGKLIYSGRESEVDLSQQLKGIYLIQITTSKQSITRKLIKQ
jgi:hypothetical protein